ncbi:MAG: hypothetical protein DRP24_01005 [Thermotoga sp.]|nr:MAG: hypothetical protein DRP23_06255 [Thermotogota bacterium]RKX57223.1 MAG: hypothetical protein DRP24_01005 [Thermotoga sp.]
MIFDMERFVKAVEKALIKIAERDLREIDISEIWVETSLPKDFILEILKKENLKVPDRISVIKDGEEVIWKRSKS